MKSKKPLPKGAAKTNSTKKPKTTVARKPVGNPPLPYHAATADRICEQLTVGKSLVQTLLLPDMPGRTTVYRWLNESVEFTNNYVRAREEQADYFADECVEIADASVGMDSAGVAAMRLCVDTRKWRAGVLKPKVYGNKLAVGGDETNTTPIVVATNASDFDALKSKLTQFTGATQ